MATFRKVEEHTSGRPQWVNMDTVFRVTTNEHRVVTLHFTNGETLTIRGNGQKLLRDSGVASSDLPTD